MQKCMCVIPTLGRQTSRSWSFLVSQLSHLVESSRGRQSTSSLHTAFDSHVRQLLYLSRLCSRGRQAMLWESPETDFSGLSRPAFLAKASSRLWLRSCLPSFVVLFSCCTSLWPLQFFNSSIFHPTTRTQFLLPEECSLLFREAFLCQLEGEVHLLYTPYIQNAVRLLIYVKFGDPACFPLTVYT